VPARADSTSAQSVDGVFRALADPTRRQVLERLNRSPASVSELAKPFDMALPSFLQHLKILESYGLVRSGKTGRVRTYQLVPTRMREAEDWLAKQRTLWTTRLDQLDSYLLELKEKNT
jgi:DNA-binding transcriptional ArsR family regulator